MRSLSGVSSVFFYPPAVYQKVSVVSVIDKERFFSSFKVLVSEGYFKVTGYSFGKKKEEENQKEEEQTADTSLLEVLQSLKKGSILPLEKSYHQRRRNLSPKTLYLRFHDSCHGKCGAAY